MIKARFYSISGRITAFVFEGHAGSAPRGENLICAAASAIAQTAIGSLQDIAGIEPQYHLADGDISCRIEYPADSVQAIKTETIMASVKLGCEQLEMSYGSDVIKCEELADSF